MAKVDFIGLFMQIRGPAENPTMQTIPFQAFPSFLVWKKDMKFNTVVFFDSFIQILILCAAGQYLSNTESIYILYMVVELPLLLNHTKSAQIVISG
jgi:hypothetical protein